MQANLLYHLTDLYVLVVIPLLASFPFALAAAPLSSPSLFAFSFSMLVFFGMASCISHALIHQPPWHRRLGAMLSSVCAYPWMQYEHLSHHSGSRAVELASSPRRPESALAFTFRRLYLVPLVSFRFRHSGAVSHTIRHPLDDLYVQPSITPLTWLLFSLVAGVSGFLVYLFGRVATPMLISLVSYIQYLGLGEDSTAHRHDASTPCVG